MFRRKHKKEVNRKPLHIRTGDMVLVISGEGRGDTPRKVLGVLPRDGKVIVEGVNVMMDRQKNRKAARQSAISEEKMVPKPCPIHRSKVALIDPQSKKRTRVKVKEQADGTRVRVAGKSGETI